jgi:hypothetical protein
MRTKSGIKRMFGMRSPSKPAAGLTFSWPLVHRAPGKSSEHLLTAYITDRAN